MADDGEDATVATGIESAAPSVQPNAAARLGQEQEGISEGGETNERNEPATNDAIDDKDGLYPFTTTRELHFDERTWWMVDLSCVADDAPNQGATPLVARCMRVHGWDEDHARRVLTAYKQFLALKKEKKDYYAKEITPSVEVEKMWKEHICDMGNYWHDCQLLCGHVINYDPDESVDENVKASRTKNTIAAMKAKFGSRFDEELWTMEGTIKHGIFARSSAKKATSKSV